MQWQEAVKVLVKPIPDSFQAKVKLERFGYPSQFAIFFLVEAQQVRRVKTIRSLPSVLLSFFSSLIVNVGVVYST